MPIYQVHGFQDDAPGQLANRQTNELLVSVTRDGSPTSVKYFIVTPMGPDLLGGKVVAVNWYGEGVFGLRLSQRAFWMFDPTSPPDFKVRSRGATWPDGVLLFNVSAVGTDGEGFGLATAVIQDPPLEEVTFDLQDLLHLYHPEFGYRDAGRPQVLPLTDPGARVRRT